MLSSWYNRSVEKKLRILVVAPPWVEIPPKGYGGAEVVIHNQVEGLVERGHYVTLFATGNSKTSGHLKYVFDHGLFDDNVHVSIGSGAVLHYHQAFQHAEEGQYDIVHIHLSAESGIIALPLIQDLTVPHLLTMHNQWPSDINEPTAKLHKDDHFVKHYTRNIRLASISKAMEHQCLKGDMRSAGIVYNSVDISKFEFNAEHGKYYAWLGRIVSYKGLREAIDAVKATGEHLLIGGLVHEEPEYFESLKNEFNDEQIIFLGPMNHFQKNELLKNAKALLNPIKWEEPFGMVMIEAMACGTPVITFDRGAAREVVEEGVSGFIVQNTEEMIARMPEIEKLDRTNVKQYVEKKFSIGKSAESLEKLMLKEIKRFERKQATKQLWPFEYPKLSPALSLNYASSV